MTNDEKIHILKNLGLWDPIPGLSEELTMNPNNINITIVPYDEYLMISAVDYCSNNLPADEAAFINELVHDFLETAISVRRHG